MKNCTTIGLCPTGLRAIRTSEKREVSGKTRGVKCWDQVDWYDSHSPRCVKQVSEKVKDHRLEKYKSKIPHQRSSLRLRTDLKERLKRQERCARGKAWGLARHISQAQRKGQKPHSLRLPTSGLCRRHPPKKTGGKRVDSGASLHMVSKKDHNSADLETMRICKSPTTVMTANGEVQTRERSHGVCQRIGRSRDSDAS